MVDRKHKTEYIRGINICYTSIHMHNKKYALSGVFSVILLFAGVFGFVLAENDANSKDMPSRKIIVFKSGVSDAEKSDSIAKAQGVKIKKMRHSDSVVAHVDARGEKKLADDPRVAYVEDDVVVETMDNTGKAAGKKVSQQAKVIVQAVQVLPWGIDRIDAEKVWPLGNTATGTDVAIIDTGISLSHPDLKLNIKGGVSEVAYTSSFNDDNGHGSHVAGIVGALNNTVGAVGAAPAVNLYAIKVLGKNGSGFLSDIIDGIDWARMNGMKVINMSLGCNCPSQVLRDAVVRAYNAGIVIVAAAGNSGGPVIYPAAYPEVIAVGATDQLNNAPLWSSRGPELDLVAPGVSIYSTYKGTSYATLSGTSMASPHVAGEVALLLKTLITPAYDTYRGINSKWDPSEVLKRLEDTASGAVGGAGYRIDDTYGFGLVNAFAAVSPAN